MSKCGVMVLFGLSMWVGLAGTASSALAEVKHEKLPTYAGLMELIDSGRAQRRNLYLMCSAGRKPCETRFPEMNSTSFPSRVERGKLEQMQKCLDNLQQNYSDSLETLANTYGAIGTTVDQLNIYDSDDLVDANLEILMDEIKRKQACSRFEQDIDEKSDSISSVLNNTAK